MLPNHPLLEFGPPPDGVAWAALLLGGMGAALAARRSQRRERLHRTGLRRRLGFVVFGLALLAALLSAGYVHFYLRGGPRVIDATAYFLQARTLAGGGMSFEVPAPSAAFRGRFLVPVAAKGAELSQGVLFPPGYPALLALGFAAGHPLWIGPLLAAALVALTYGLAFRLSGRLRVAVLAATLSVLSAALRYHTADTMSHGWAAVLFTGALWAALGPRATGARAGHVLVSGLCIGWLFATRPLTGLLCGAAAAWFVVRARTPGSGAPWSRLVLFGAGLTPGLALLLWQHIELTGGWLNSVQLRYYALADGPPGCFGLGLGDRLGCHYEHGDVVARFGERGFGPFWALRNTLHRLHHHALDFANWEPAWLLVLWAGWRKRKHTEARVLIALALGLMGGYATFYFHGNEPGVGARFFSELLPVEHALVAWAASGTLWARWLPPIALLGFACHGSYSHRALADRLGGRPMYEPAVVERALGPSHGGALVFVDTDHGFHLGHDPKLPRDHVPPGRTLVARWSGDASDRLLWERLGEPLAFRYRFALDEAAQPPVLQPVSWDIPVPATLRFEAENQWPALALTDGWVEPSFTPAACVSGGRGLHLHATGPASSLQGHLDVRVPGPHQVVLGGVRQSQGAGTSPQGRWIVDGQERLFDLPAGGSSCFQVDLGTVVLSRPTVLWTLTTAGHPLMIDFLEVTATTPSLATERAPTPWGRAPPLKNR